MSPETADARGGRPAVLAVEHEMVWGGGYAGPVADLRVAIIGYGLAGRFFHAPLVAATDGLAVVSVVTSSPERRGVVAREHPGAVTLASPAELWERAGEHDLVVLATPGA